MGTAEALAVKQSVRSEPTVVTCYDLLDLACTATEERIEDFTDGMYHGDPETPYAVAQENQIRYLLDQAGCTAGSRLLDIGCGYGNLLSAARRRGAEAVGITISPAQVERCRRKGLDVRLCDYRNLDEQYTGRFDGLVANGSAEHFVQARDAAAGRQDAIYEELFAIAHRLLDPASPSGRFVTTIIHFDWLRIDPARMLGSPWRFRWGSDEFHYGLLVHAFGGFYPRLGQLERCAAPYFRLEAEEDGTEDYRLTSEHWLAVLRRAAATNPPFQVCVLGKLARHPRQAWLMFVCLLFAQSWNWQFRGPRPPMKLLRQTWSRRPAG